jgi:hypothetical protein
MIWASVISGAAAVIGALVLRKVQQVHLLVNSRLDKTLAEIADLKAERDRNQKANAPGEDGGQPSQPATPRPGPA